MFIRLKRPLFVVLSVLLLCPSRPSSTASSASLELVQVSSHVIEVPGGSAGSQPLRLAATLYQPRFLPSAPAAIYIHGWGGRRLMGTDNLAYDIATAGYVVLSYTARGFGEGESGGQVSLAGPDELNDLSRVIDWLQGDPDHVIIPRVTKIGVIGGSYGGGHSFQIASDPRVSAVIPLVGWTDLEQSLFPNGAINYKLGIAEFYSGLEREVGLPPFYNYSQLEFDLFDAAAEGRLPPRFVRKQLRARSIAERNDDGREVLKESRQPRAPVFIIQSWDDYLFPAPQVLDVFSQVTVPKQIYLGRTGHPPGGNNFEGEDVYIAAQVLRWFDHYLRGIGGTDSRPVSSAPAPFDVPGIRVDGQLVPPDATSAVLFIKPGGNLQPRKKGPDSEDIAGGIFRTERLRSSRSGAEIPSQADMLSGHAEAIGGVPGRLVYSSGPWLSDTELIGPSEFTLHVSSQTSTDVDLIVRTIDVAPDGTETEVTAGVTRVSGLRPGEIRQVTFRDYGDDWIFKRGHWLRLKISNMDFPDFRPPGANDNVLSTITIHCGRSFPSAIRFWSRAR